MENEPRNLAKFLDEARPDRERLRLVAQALAGTSLERNGAGTLDGQVSGGYTTPKEQAALKKLVGNWRALIEQQPVVREAALFQYLDTLEVEK